MEQDRVRGNENSVLPYPTYIPYIANMPVDLSWDTFRQEDTLKSANK